MKHRPFLKNFDAVIFDMDGTLVDSEPIWEEVDMRVFHEGLGLLTHTKEYRKRFIGMGMGEDEFRAILADFKLAQEALPKIVDTRKKLLMELYNERLELFQGARELLETLSPKKKLALASSSSLDLINCVVDRFHIRDYFRVLVSVEEVAHGKPFPDIFLYTARKLMTNPTRCLVVEDSVHGIRAGKTAGMSVVAVRQTVKDKEGLSQADWIFDDIVAFSHELYSKAS